MCLVLAFSNFFPSLLHEKRRTKAAAVFQADCTLRLISLSSSPCPLKRGKVFVVFWRNKELLREVGRRDFELGSDPVFPVERVEIVLEEWYIRSNSMALSWGTQNSQSFIHPPPYYLQLKAFGGEERKDKTKCVVRWNGTLWDLGSMKL